MFSLLFAPADVSGFHRRIFFTKSYVTRIISDLSTYEYESHTILRICRERKTLWKYPASLISETNESPGNRKANSFEGPWQKLHGSIGYAEIRFETVILVDGWIPIKFPSLNNGAQRGICASEKFRKIAWLLPDKWNRQRVQFAKGHA